MDVRSIITALGGYTILESRLRSVSARPPKRNAIYQWVQLGEIPRAWHACILQLCKESDIALTLADLDRLSARAAAERLTGGQSHIIEDLSAPQSRKTRAPVRLNGDRV